MRSDIPEEWVSVGAAAIKMCLDDNDEAPYVAREVLSAVLPLIRRELSDILLSGPPVAATRPRPPPE